MILHHHNNDEIGYVIERKDGTPLSSDDLMVYYSINGVISSMDRTDGMFIIYDNNYSGKELTASIEIQETDSSGVSHSYIIDNLTIPASNTAN